MELAFEQLTLIYAAEGVRAWLSKNRTGNDMIELFFSSSLLNDLK